MAKKTTQRNFSIADLFRLQRVRAAVFSPDGQWLVYELERAADGEPNRRLVWEYAHARSDLWLVAVGGGRPRNLTLGRRRGAGAWLPVWSPDSRRLAFLSAVGAAYRLNVFHLSSARLKPFNNLPITHEYFMPSTAPTSAVNCPRSSNSTACSSCTP